MQPNSGTITFDGQPIQAAPPEAIVGRGLVHVPEGRRLFTLMTVRENLEMGAFTPHAYGKLKESMEEVYEIFPRLKERENQLAGTLSGGEQQMVAVGRGIMARPRVMMFDEPSLGLSPVLRKEIFTTVQMVAKRGVTVLLVEQDVNESLGNQRPRLRHGTGAGGPRGERPGAAAEPARQEGLSGDLGTVPARGLAH